MTEKAFANPKPPEIPIASNFKKVLRQHGDILSGVMVLIILFSFTNDSFFIANNITNITLQVSIIVITAYRMTHMLLLGDIDLPAGSTIALTSTFVALGAPRGIPFVLLVLLSIITALTLGMISGGLTATAGTPSPIITVAAMGIFRGIAYIVTGGIPIMIKDDAFLALGNGELLYIPIPIQILTILLLINHFIPIKTTFGRKIYVTGGNKKVAIYSGIDVIRLKIKILMTTAVLAGISRAILASCLYSGQPNSTLSYKLDAIATTILGGISLNGGCGTMMGMVAGTLITGAINNGMNLMNAPYFYQIVVKGLVIFVVVYSDVRNKRKHS